jgi:hypothetical protein
LSGSWRSTGKPQEAGSLALYRKSPQTSKVQADPDARLAASAGLGVYRDADSGEVVTTREAAEATGWR